jgi:hypothetical protein
MRYLYETEREGCRLDLPSALGGRRRLLSVGEREALGVDGALRSARGVPALVALARNGVPVDFQAVLASCADRGNIISARVLCKSVPYRLDLVPVLESMRDRVGRARTCPARDRF